MIRMNKHLFLSLHEIQQDSCKEVWADHPDMDQSSKRPRVNSTSFTDRSYLQAGHTYCSRVGSVLQQPKHRFCDKDWLILLRIQVLTRKTFRAIRQDRARLDAHGFSSLGYHLLATDHGECSSNCELKRDFQDLG